jgi:hypothetical protein
MAGKEMPEVETAIEDGRNDGQMKRRGANSSPRVKRSGGRGGTAKAKKNGNKKR